MCTLLALIWSAVVQIDKVTRGSGRIVTQQTKQEVQHLEGGIVAEILVKEGETVVAGQPLMRVENRFFKSELAQAAIEMAAKRVRLARLQAETTGAKDVPFSRDMMGASREGIESELALFRRRQANLGEQLSILVQQQRQKEIELSELRSRLPSVTREKQISEERYASLQKLSAAGAASNNDRLETERVMQQTVARLSDLAHEIPRTEAALAEIGQRKAEVTSRFQAEAEKDRTQTTTDTRKTDQEHRSIAGPHAAIRRRCAGERRDQQAQRHDHRRRRQTRRIPGRNRAGRRVDRHRDEIIAGGPRRCLARTARHRQDQRL